MKRGWQVEAYVDDGSVLKTYTIVATSSNGITVEQDVNSQFLSRQATSGGVQFSPYIGFEDGADGAESTYEGIRVQVFVGMFADGEKHMDDGVHSYASSNQRQFVGQQTYTLTVGKSGSSTSYTHPLVTIDGDVAKWTSDYSGAKSSSTAETTEKASSSVLSASAAFLRVLASAP